MYILHARAGPSKGERYRVGGSIVSETRSGGEMLFLNSTKPCQKWPLLLSEHP